MNPVDRGAPGAAMGSIARASLVQEVYRCTHCVPLVLPFATCTDAGRFFRFPPVIGAPGAAEVLFVGINPRVSPSNLPLHTALMRDISAFQELAANSYRERDYIGPQGQESHYSLHLWIASQLFPGRRFASVAAVTELFFCASESSARLPVEQSPCADKYLGRVLASTRPKLVVAVGSRVANYLAGRFPRQAQYAIAAWGDHGRAPIIPVPHPNSRGEKHSRTLRAVEVAREYLISGNVPALPAVSATTAREPRRLSASLRGHAGPRDAGRRDGRVDATPAAPRASRSELARLVQDPEPGSIQRDWTGNDKSARNHNGIVDLRESPLRLRLSWKRNPDDQAKFIGVFDLDLPRLLAANYIRVEGNRPSAVRLRFWHGYDDVIYIQVNSQTRGLPLGRIV